MTLNDLRTALEERLSASVDALEESSSVAPNSYRHGHDSGFTDALREVISLLNGETT